MSEPNILVKIIMNDEFINDEVMKYFPYKECPGLEIYGNNRSFHFYIENPKNKLRIKKTFTLIDFSLDKKRKVFISKKIKIPNWAMNRMINNNIIIFEDSNIYINPIFLLKLI